MLAASLLFVLAADPGPCAKALNAAKGQRPLAAARTALRGCGELVAEPRCREAFEGATAEQPPVVGIVLGVVTQACGEAYCPGLAEPKPALCKDPGHFELAAQPDAWGALIRAVQKKEGAKKDREALAARFIEVITAAAWPPVDAVVVRIGAQTGGLAISVAQGGGTRAEAWFVPAPELDAATLDRLAGAVKGKSARLQLEKKLAFGTFKGLLHALSTADAELYLEAR